MLKPLCILSILVIGFVLPAHGQDATSKTIDSQQLVVIEGFQVGRGVARIDPSDMARLGCQPGDILMITGGRTTAAKVVPSAIVERGQQTIQMDSKVRQNSASGKRLPDRRTTAISPANKPSRPATNAISPSASGSSQTLGHSGLWSS